MMIFRFNIFIVLIALITLGCAGTHAGQKFGEDTRMPEWFWETPKSGSVRFAVGYAPAPNSPYVPIEGAYRRAFEDGVRRLYIDQQCRVKGERATGSGADGLFSLGEIRDFIYNESAAEQYITSATPIDSFATRNIVIVLVGTASADVDNDLEYSPDPECVKPRSSGTNSAIGNAAVSFSFHKYRYRDWQTCEESARFEAALTLESNVMHTQRVHNGRMVNVSVHHTDIHNCSFTTVRRAIDLKNKRVWVWAAGRR